MAGHKRGICFLFLLCLPNSVSSKGEFVQLRQSSFGHIYAVRTVRSVFECCIQCFNDDACNSAAFNIVDKICELNNRSPFDFPYTSVNLAPGKDLLYLNSEGRNDLAKSLVREKGIRRLLEFRKLYCGKFLSCDAITDDKYVEVSWYHFVKQKTIMDNWEPCPEPWILFDRHCYLLVAVRNSWKESENYCQTMGANLADITDAYVNRFVVELKRSDGFLPVWIGIGNYHTVTTHVWTSGKSVAYTNFHQGEPNNANGIEECIRIYGDAWSDDPCDLSSGSVCKKRQY